LGIGSDDDREGHGDGGLKRPGPDAAQRLLELDKGLLDWVHIRRIAGEKGEVIPGRLDACSGGGAPMHTAVIQIHELAWAQGGDQNSFYEGLEDQPINSTLDQQAVV
jgi:hypothetical protein